MIGAIITAVLGFLSKVLDFLNPWSSVWANRAKTKDAKKAESEKKLNESAKKEGDDDAFLDALNDSNNP